MTPIISVEKVSKQYRIGTQKAAYGTLRDSFTNAVISPFRRLRSPLVTRHSSLVTSEMIWALKDVSFEVKPGEVIGVIGRNGAGKSTLLKILSRITEPTSGAIDMYGRVGSLLEVGTGFHPELTGRENIALNGAILGMKRAEIQRKFDEIVAFAEVEQFIDTPVKRYSTGMYMRLAFAVAAHLEPEILLVDEVLAVGDPPFQKKCLGKMNEVAREGRTVLFVSHNMSAISKLCQTCVFLRRGSVAAWGETRSVISEYMAAADSITGYREWPDPESAPGDEFIRARSVAVVDSAGAPVQSLRQDSAFRVAIEYQVLKRMRNANVGFDLRDDSGVTVFRTLDADSPEWSGRGREPGLYKIECTIPDHFLNEGRYYLTLVAGIPFIKFSLNAEDVLVLDIEPPTSDEGPAGRLGVRRPGIIAPALEWQVHCSQQAGETRL